ARGGVVNFSDGRIGASYGRADGLPMFAVRDIRLAHDGALWISTEAGVSRADKGRVATLTSRDGLPCDEARWVLEDDARSLWVDMSCGLVDIPRAEIDKWIAANDAGRPTGKTMSGVVFDATDGVRAYGTVGYSSVATRSSDGKLWFRSADGVSVVDPHRLPF